MSGAASSSSSAMPYIGSKISLITNSELRYEGTLVNINTSNSTVTLQDVRMSGTENRKAPHFVMPSSEVFDYIVFNGKDIKDLTVSESNFSVKEDPAVVAVNVAPANVGYTTGDPGMRLRRGPNHGQEARPMGGPSAYSPMGRYGRREYLDYNIRGSKINGTKAVVGELIAQPNNSLKSQVAAAFDFDAHNAKFTKSEAEREMIAGNAAPVYDKNVSFFDNISCETLNRQRGRDSKVDREKQRELDTETFGPSAALARGPRYFRRGGYRRGGGVRGGRGGYGVTAGMYGNGRPEYYGPSSVFPPRTAYHIHAQ